MAESGRPPAGRREPAYALSEFTSSSATVSTAPPTAKNTVAVGQKAWSRGSGWRELALGLGIFAIYLVVTRRVQVSHLVADGHARWLMRFEHALHIDVEQPLNSWLGRHHTLGLLAAWEYATTYIVTTFGFLGWLWWRRREYYRWARSVLVISTLIAIGCFAIWPLTPPRLLRSAGFTDVVASHHPFLSWGSNTVSAGADQWAAMPSLHIGWAVWVTVAALRVGTGTLGRGLAAAHLLVTSYVVVATGNHFVLDISAGVVLVAVAMLAYPAWVLTTGWAARRGAIAFEGRSAWRAAGPTAPPRPLAVPVPAADAFFVHVETADVPQIVGGVALLDTGGRDVRIDTAHLRALLASRIPEVAQFRRYLRPATRWRRPLWVEADDVDLRYHVRSTRIMDGAGRRGLERLVALLASRPFDPKRPPWRLWFVHDVGPNEAAAVVLMHHAVGDGICVVDILRHLLEPVFTPRMPVLPRRPGPVLRSAAVALGIAQLAFDGRAQRLPITGTLTRNRLWRTIEMPLRYFSSIARAHRTGVTNVLLAAFGEVVGELLDERGVARQGATMRIAVPITLRRFDESDAARGSGNLTAAVRIDVPLDVMTPAERLAAVHACAQRKRRASRVLATTAVVRAIGLLPPALHRRAARAMYRSRFFTAIVTNMPGPRRELSFAGLPLKDVYPVVPLADGVPLAAGTLGWNGSLCLSVTADPTLLPEARDIDVRLRQALERLAADSGVERGATDTHVEGDASVSVAAEPPSSSQRPGAWPPSSV